jgi:hypothetical protein
VPEGAGVHSEFTGFVEGFHGTREGSSQGALLRWEVFLHLSNRSPIMRPPKRLVAGIASAALAIGVGASLADAASSGGGRGPGPGPAPASQAIATYRGLSAAEIRTQLESGKTLADIAKAQGKTVNGLEDAIVADAKTHLDQAVTDGKLTSAQAASMLADLKSHVDDMVNGVAPAGGPGGRGGPGHGPFDLGVVTDYLGITAAQLRTQLEAGKSLADVAKAQGKTVAGLEDAIVAAATTQLDAAVAAGKLTAAQEAAMLADLKAHVDDMVSRTGPPPRGPGHGPGPFGAPGPSSSGTTTTNRPIIR